MRPWSDFYDIMSPDVPGCPQAMQEVALRQAAIAFCEQSLAWKYTHTDIPVVVGTADYAFTPPSGAVVHAITYARFNDTDIDYNVGPDDILIWDWRHQDGMPEYVLGSSTLVTLVPTPNLEGTLKLIVALKPSPVADGIDDDIYNEYREAIMHRALWILMLSPKKPYTNPTLATWHMQQFFIKTGVAAVRAARSFTRAPLRTTIMRRR